MRKLAVTSAFLLAVSSMASRLRLSEVPPSRHLRRMTDAVAEAPHSSMPLVPSMPLFRDQDPRADVAVDPRDQRPLTNGRASNTARIAVTFPSSTWCHSATGAGGATLECRSYQTTTSGPSAQTLWIVRSSLIWLSPWIAWRNLSALS